MVADDLLGHLTHHRSLTLGIDPASLHLGAQDAVEVVDDVTVGQASDEPGGPDRVRPPQRLSRPGR